MGASDEFRTQPDGNATSPTDGTFDELALRAGRALQRPAPAHGLDDIARRGRRDQRLKVAAVTGAAVLLVVGAIVLLTDDDRSETITPVATTVPKTIETSAVVVPSTTVAEPTSNVPTSTASSEASAVPTVPTAGRTLVLTPGASIDQPSSVAAYSADGTVIASVALGSGRVRTFDAGSLQLRDELNCPVGGPPLPAGWDLAARSAVSAVAANAAASVDSCPITFGSDGRTAAMGSSIWDTTDGSSVQVEGRNAVVSPDGATVVTGEFSTGSHGVRVWDAGTGALIAAANHPVAVGGVFSPDSRSVVTLGRADAVVADAHTLAPLTTLAGRQAFSAVFSPDGSRIVTATFDGASIWDRSTGRELLHVAGNGEVFTVALSPDGTLLATGSIGGSAMIFDAATGQELAKFPHQGDSDQWTIAFSPDGSSLVLAGTIGVQVFGVSG